MLMFLASVLEQLDLALEHVSKRDVHNARFGLMLTDNAVELFLHHLAKDRARHLKVYTFRRETYPHQKALDNALGRAFDAKVKFAKLEYGLTEDVARTINIMHEFRNEVYHVGIQHEAILSEITKFYLDTACRYLGTYKPSGLSWGSNQKLPERAKKYFPNFESFMPGGYDDFGKGCVTIANLCRHEAADTIAVLADHMDDVIQYQDSCLDEVAGGVYVGQQTTRDEAVIGCQTWPLAFSDKGKAFAAEHGFSDKLLHLPDWLAANYPIEFRSDPIPSWEKRAAALRKQKNPHVALAQYESFMKETMTLREEILHAAELVDAEIQSAIDRARGK